VSWDENSLAIGSSLMLIRPSEGLFQHLLTHAPTAASFDGCRERERE